MRGAASVCTMNIAACPQLTRAFARFFMLLGTSPLFHELLIFGQQDESEVGSVAEQIYSCSTVRCYQF